MRACSTSSPPPVFVHVPPTGYASQDGSVAVGGVLNIVTVAPATGCVAEFDVQGEEAHRVEIQQAYGPARFIEANVADLQVTVRDSLRSVDSSLPACPVRSDLLGQSSDVSSQGMLGEGVHGAMQQGHVGFGVVSART